MTIITEDYVSFEIAKLLKEKGFNEIVSYAYDDEGMFWGKTYHPEGVNIGRYDAPTLQMAMKWLREVHNLDIIAPPQFDNSKWTYSAIIFKLSIPCTEIKLNDNKNRKEEAYEAAIKCCLENLI